MAYLIIWPPGSDAGPCVDTCAHRDCAELRADADRRCPVCAKPLGYESKLSNDASGRLSHFACLLAAAEGK